MLVRTRKHPTNKKPRTSIENQDFIPWREVAKEEIEKHTEIGLMVRGGRFKANLTQKELAELIGARAHHISEMEHGKRPIGKKMAHKLAEIFNVDYRLFL